MDYLYRYDSPLGGITMASDGDALTGLWFDGQEHKTETLCADHAGRNLPVFEETKRWLDIYFSGEEPDFIPALHMRGTAFRRIVWEILLTIPYGRTMTYGEIADRIAARQGMSRMSAQAVGGAVAHNAIALIVPCHRVIGSDGSMTGYAAGTEKKKYLLNLEKKPVDTTGHP